jgi:hypothetical protein
VESPRSLEQRTADALAKLKERHADVWVASSSDEHPAHLVPLSFAWDDQHVILATESAAVTTRNLVRSRRARLAFGSTRDVVMVDAVLSSEISVDGASPVVGDRYAEQADWDPRSAAGQFTYLLLRPDRIQVWREANEITGRTVMQGGRWQA